jgi:hypothetical protein
MIEIFLASVFAFFGIWFFGLRSALRRRGISTVGADFFQAFIKDVLLGVSLARKGDQIVSFVLIVMFICALLAVVSIVLLTGFNPK